MVKVAMAERDWLRPTEASFVLGLSANYVRYLTDTGRLETRRSPTGDRMISRESVQALARARAGKR